MDTQTWIELLGVILAGGASAGGLWRLKSRRWHLVSDVVTLAERYLASSGDSDEALAERGDACNEFRQAAKQAEELNDSRLDTAVRALAEAMEFEAGELAVRSELAAVRKRRWR